jgi:hypothetical protein
MIDAFAVSAGDLSLRSLFCHARKAKLEDKRPSRSVPRAPAEKVSARSAAMTVLHRHYLDSHRSNRSARWHPYLNDAESLLTQRCQQEVPICSAVSKSKECCNVDGFLWQSATQASQHKSYTGVDTNRSPAKP